MKLSARHTTSLQKTYCISLPWAIDNIQYTHTYTSYTDKSQHPWNTYTMYHWGSSRANHTSLDLIQPDILPDGPVCTPITRCHCVTIILLSQYGCSISTTSLTLIHCLIIYEEGTEHWDEFNYHGNLGSWGRPESWVISLHDLLR